MKILIIGERFYPEEFLINDIANYWASDGHEIHVLTQNPSYPFGKIYCGYKNKFFQNTVYQSIIVHRFYTICGYKESKVKKILNYFLFPLLGTVYTTLYGRNFDTVFIYHTGSLMQAIPAIILKKLYNKPVNIWTWDIWPDGVYAYGFKPNFFLKTFLNWLVKFIYLNCNNIFISSPGFKGILNKIVPTKELILAPNWNQPTPVSDCKISFNTGYNYIFAGNIGKVQNLENVIRGFDRAQKETTHLHLNIIGDGSALEDLKLLVKDSNISNVHFWGRVSSKEIQAFYEVADALIISLNPDPAFDPYIPSKFQSYLSTGKPILCAMRGSVADIVNAYQIGIVTDPKSIEQIADSFLKITVLSKIDLERITAISKDLLNQLFNREKTINAISSIVLSNY